MILSVSEELAQRLREEAHNPQMDCDNLCPLFVEAADHIDRLTSERDLLHDDYRQLLLDVEHARRERDERDEEIQLVISERDEARQALEEIAHLSEDMDKSVWFSEAVDIARRAISEDKSNG